MKGSEARENVFWDLQFGEFAFLDLELADEIEHAPWVRGFDIDALEHLCEKKVSRFFRVALEHHGSDEINEEAGDGVGVADQVQCKFNQLFLKLALEGDDDILNVVGHTISSLQLLVTEIWHSSDHAKYSTNTCRVSSFSAESLNNYLLACS